ncbi:MAG: radical SAM protein [Lentisphaerae bacterium]|nr:radical SAM protein [Lentisphaerota bacterium]
MRVLLIQPPMTQVNTPYPATPFLTGFLRRHGVETEQADLAIELITRLFSRTGLQRVLDQLGPGKSPAVQHLRDHRDAYLATIDVVVGFLQGRDPALALRIATRHFLPEGPRFAAIEQFADHDDENTDPLNWAFGALGLQDLAKYLATLYLEDLTDAIRDGIDPHFELARYAEHLAASAPTFDPIQAALDAPPTLIDDMLAELTAQALQKHAPALIGITAPFPGNVYGAFRIAAAVRRLAPDVRLALGGGYVNTELRELQEPRVFNYFDFVCLDDGEQPLLRLVEHVRGSASPTALVRTFVRENGRVVWHHDPTVQPLPHTETSTPTYAGLKLDQYLSVFELLNPMHRIWSDGRWNKLMVAHGCYWSQCTFCDLELDYIKRYSIAPADHLVDQIEAVVRETGQTGFHFVDEAAPPALLKALAQRLLERRVTITWWGNIRFDKTFTAELCALLARSGCVAVSGGLEVAEDRLLKLMRKGVSVEQVARVTRHFVEAGVMVHAYLMYAFPTQTVQETVDALEFVRQLFAAGCIQSGYWHRFALTVHSPIYKDPGAYGIQLKPAPHAPFARNEAFFVDPVGTDHEALGTGLRKALYNYMHGVGLEADVRDWFDGKVPPTRIAPDYIEQSLQA